jgi:hypothetical protein
MKCDYHESCSDEASVQLFLSSPEDEQNLSTPNYYCNEHAEVVRKEGIVNKEVYLPNEDSEFIIGSTAKETSKFKDTLQDLNSEESQE